MGDCCTPLESPKLANLIAIIGRCLQDNSKYKWLLLESEREQIFFFLMSEFCKSIIFVVRKNVKSIFFKTVSVASYFQKHKIPFLLSTPILFSISTQPWFFLLIFIWSSSFRESEASFGIILEFSSNPIEWFLHPHKLKIWIFFFFSVWGGSHVRFLGCTLFMGL